MHPSSDFKKDLRDGHHGEGYVAMLLARKLGGMVVPGPEGRFSDYDFSIERRTRKSYEVKLDLASPNTGRCFIEFQCSGQASGVARTKADWYAHVVPGKHIFVFNPKRLLEWLETTESTSVVGGDGGRAEGYLPTIKDLQNLVQTSPEWAFCIDLE